MSDVVPNAGIRVGRGMRGVTAVGNNFEGGPTVVGAGGAIELDGNSFSDTPAAVVTESDAKVVARRNRHTTKRKEQTRLAPSADARLIVESLPCLLRRCHK